MNEITSTVWNNIEIRRHGLKIEGAPPLKQSYSSSDRTFIPETLDFEVRERRQLESESSGVWSRDRRWHLAIAGPRVRENGSPGKGIVRDVYSGYNFNDVPSWVWEVLERELASDFPDFLRDRVKASEGS